MMSIYSLQCAAIFGPSLLALLLSEVLRREDWNEILGRSLPLASGVFSTLAWLSILETAEVVSPLVRFAALLNLLFVLGVLGLPRRTVQNPSETRWIVFGFLLINAGLHVENSRSAALAITAVLALLYSRISKSAKSDPVEREPKALLRIFHGLGSALLLLGVYLGDPNIPLPVWQESAAVWGNMKTLPVALLFLGSWISCGLFPFSSCFLSMVSAKRDNFVYTLLYLEALGLIYVRYLIPVFISQPSLHVAGVFIFGATMLASALLLFSEQQPRRVGALLFLSQMSFALLGLRGESLQSFSGLRITIGVAFLSITGILLVSSVLLVRLGRGYSQSCTGLAANMPFLACCFLVCLLSFSGFPGTIGFIAEESLVRRAFDNRHLVLSIAIFSLALNGFSCFRLFGRIFLGEGTVERFSAFKLKLRERVALACLLAVLVIPGILPEQSFELFRTQPSFARNEKVLQNVLP